MAKVQFGSGVAYISGRVAGTVHARNKGGSYVRRMSIPVNPATTFQQNVRSSLADNSAGWRNLAAADQMAWEAWAKTHPIVDRLGAAILLSGQQAYVALNRNAFSNGDGANFYTTPPAEPAFEYPFEKDFAVTMDGGAGTFVITQTVQPAADTQVFIYASPAVSPGRVFVKNLTKFLGAKTVLAATAVPVDVDIAADWVARFGSITAGLSGKRVAVGVRIYNNGQLSGLTSSSGIIA